MPKIVQLALALVVAYGYALVVRPALQMSGKAGAFFAFVAALIVLACPLLIARDGIVLRAIMAVFCTDLSLKMIDYARQYAHGREASIPYTAYLRFLIPFPVLLVVFGERERRLPAAPPLGREFAIVCLCAILIAAGVALLSIVSGLAAVKSSFPLNHAVMLPIFVVTIEAISRLLWGLERLARFDTTPIIDRAYLATTPGEFWRRWNTRVGAWLERNVFRPSGGRRAPVRGIFLAFFASAVLHEVMFAIATSRFTGCQFAFFILQAPAVILSHRITPFVNRGGPAIKTVARILTVLWFYVTSVLFFEGVNRVFPFIYASQPWLPWGQ